MNPTMTEACVSDEPNDYTPPKDGGSAFPLPLAVGAAGDVYQAGRDGDGGMSLRDWFAGMALQGLIAHHAWNYKADDVAGAVSSISYEIADAMIRARES
jgi:hypothetical protein